VSCSLPYQRGSAKSLGHIVSVNPGVPPITVTGFEKEIAVRFLSNHVDS